LIEDGNDDMVIFVLAHKFIFILNKYFPKFGSLKINQNPG